MRRAICLEPPPDLDVCACEGEIKPACVRMLPVAMIRRTKRGRRIRDPPCFGIRREFIYER